MPIRQFHRAWCKKCNDWTLFAQKPPNNEDYFCTECEEKHVSCLLSEIPHEKLLEQRKRYKQNKKEEFSYMFAELMNPTASWLKNMFSEPGYNDVIIESDAGQKQIDEKEREIREQKRIEAEQIKKDAREEYKKYVGLGRNETCVCGSGKKYKKCECFEKIRDIRTKYKDFR